MNKCFSVVMAEAEHFDTLGIESEILLNYGHIQASAPRSENLGCHTLCAAVGWKGCWSLTTESSARQPWSPQSSPSSPPSTSSNKNDDLSSGFRIRWQSDPDGPAQNLDEKCAEITRKGENKNMTEGSKVIENSDNILLIIIINYMGNFYERRVCGSGINYPV